MILSGILAETKKNYIEEIVAGDVEIDFEGTNKMILIMRGEVAKDAEKDFNMARNKAGRWLLRKAGVKMRLEHGQGR